MILAKKRRKAKAGQRDADGRPATGFDELEAREMEMLARARKELGQPAARSAVSIPALFLSGVLILSLISFLYLIQTSQVASLGYQIKHLEATQASLQRDTERLQADLSREQSPDKVEDVARSKLGMAPVTSTVYLQVSGGRPAHEDSAEAGQQASGRGPLFNLDRVLVWASGAAEAGEP